MVIFLNGAFGIGKTTLARELRRRLPRSRIYDPVDAAAGTPAELAADIIARLDSRRQ